MFGFGFKNRTVQKFDIDSDGLLIETACNPQFKLKVTKITSLALKVQIKTF